MIRSVRNDVTLRFETFRYQACLHRVEYLARNDSSTQGARVARSNAEEEARTQDMLGRCTGTRRDQDCAAQFAIRRRGTHWIMARPGRGYGNNPACFQHLGAFCAQAGSWRENNLLAPTRRRSSPGPRTHDGTSITQRPDEMWAIDGTSCMTDQGSATVFVVIDHCTGECLGARAAKCGTRHEAIDTLRQAIRATRGTFDRDVAAGVALRHDHGSQFISHAFQDELRFVGIRSSPSFVRSPEGNGCVERFIRTLKEQLLWLTRFASVEEPHAAWQEFADRFNNLWILGRLGYKTPAQHRRSFLVEAA